MKTEKILGDATFGQIFKNKQMTSQVEIHVFTTPACLNKWSSNWSFSKAASSFNFDESSAEVVQFSSELI